MRGIAFASLSGTFFALQSSLVLRKQIFKVLAVRIDENSQIPQQQEFRMNSLIDTAVKKLSEQSLSEHALRQHLEAKFAGLSNLDSRIDAVFKRLNELQLLNDLRVARNLAQHYAHKGDRLIIRLLQQKGFEDTVIRQALSSLDNEINRALEEARIKLGAAWDNSEQSIALLYRFLSGRAFSDTTIHAVMNTIGDKKRYQLRAA